MKIKDRSQRSCKARSGIFCFSNFKPNKIHKKKLAAVTAVTAAAVLFGGCTNEGPVDESYRIFSDGTYIEIFEGYGGYSKKNDTADFYVPNGMITNYLSGSLLNESELELYDQILSDLGAFKEWVPLTVDANIYGRVLDLIRLEQLSYIQVSGRAPEYNVETQSYGVAFTYRLDADEVSSMNMAAERAAKKIMENITPDMDDYEKLKYFHDYLILNCETSTTEEFADTIYGALVKGKAQCEGYSKAFSYLCNLAGIENILVTGEAYVAHMWNMVKLGGNWYHIDVTWDDSNDGLHKEYPDIILYQYFMITDSVIKNNHLISEYPAEPPKANGRTENYFIREGTYVSDKDEFITASENAIMNAVSNGEQGAMVKFETNDVYISTVYDPENKFLSEVFDTVISRAKSAYGADIKLSWTDYYGQYRILTYIIEYQ